MSNLYRNLLKESKKLPDSNAVHFYQNRIKAGFRKECGPDSTVSVPIRLKQGRKLLRELQAANDGYLHALVRVLDHTYGRRGIVKQALLRPFTNLDPTSKTPQSFGNALSSLITSPIAHTSKPPSKSALLRPPLLPPRAFPDTEEARLLGPLSQNRINKIRLRYRNEQIGKVKPPIAFLLDSPSLKITDIKIKQLLAQQQLSKVTLGSEILESLETKARVPPQSQPLPPKRLQSFLSLPSPPLLRSSLKSTSKKPLRIHPPTLRTTKWTAPLSLTPRVLRRRYQNILSQSPIVVGGIKGEMEINFGVKESSWSSKGNGRIAVMSEDDLKWI